MKVKIIAWHADLESYRVRLLSSRCENCVGTCGVQVKSRPAWTSELLLGGPAQKFSCGDTAELVASGKALGLAASIIFLTPMVFLLLSVAVATFLEQSDNVLFAVAGLSLTAGVGVSVICGMQLNWLKLFDLQLNSIGNRNEP